MKRIISSLLSLVMLFALLPLQVLATENVYTENIVVDVDLPDNAELFAAYAERTFYPEYAVSVWGTSARERLTTKASKAVYDWLKEKVTEVANGRSLNTTFKMTDYDFDNLGIFCHFDASSYTVQQAYNEFGAMIDMGNVINALLSDCPYEMYWFDKTAYMPYNLYATTYSTEIRITSLVITMQVAEAYREKNYSSDTPRTNSTLCGAASAAADNAQAIVNKYADLSDYEKLCAYRDEICELVEYNTDATTAGTVYGDPWQLIYVFDNNDATNVVCEGYSKAFQYLCDKTDFSHSDVACYSVAGTTATSDGSGGHMWNIVTMHGGINYLVDVTNSDAGTVGQDGGLFLSGVSGSIANGYTATLSKALTYNYYSETTAFWGTDSESILNLSANDYDPEQVHVTVSAGSNIKYDGYPISISAGGDVKYSISTNNDLSEYTVEFKWYSYSNGVKGDSLSETPVDAGNYWVDIIVTDKSDANESYTAGTAVTINPAPLRVYGAWTESKVYDGTTATPIAGVQLLDVYMRDEGEVGVDLSRITGEFTSADAGKKTQVKLHNVYIDGTKAHNYYLERSEYTAYINNTVYITQAENTTILDDVQSSYDVSETDKNTFAFTVEPIEGAEYKMDDGEWTDNNVFELIAPESAHTFYVRIKETKNYTAGATASIALTFNKLINAESPILAIDVIGDSGNRTITIYKVDGAEYSFDGGQSWSDNNVLTGINNTVVDCAIRYKETATHNASFMRQNSINTAKKSQKAPDAFEIEFVIHPDGGGCDAIIPKVPNGLYSFDGINYSTNNVKTDCLPNTTYTAYVKFAENDEFLESAPTVCTAVSPACTSVENPNVILGDINNSGAIDMMDYILLKRNYFGTFEFNEVQIKSGDVNESGAIDMMDYILLKRAYFGTFNLEQ